MSRCADARAALLRAYEVAVVAAARTRGLPHRDFGEAATALPPEVFDRMRKAYAAQVAALDDRDG